MNGTLGQALAAYMDALTRHRTDLASAEETPSAGSSFDALVRQELSAAVDSLARGEAAAVAGLMGKASIQEVVEAVSSAELSLQKVTAVRDRVIAAYQEIMRMPV